MAVTLPAAIYHERMEFEAACDRGEADAVSAYLSAGLYKAARKGRHSVVAELLSHAAMDVNVAQVRTAFLSHRDPPQCSTEVPLRLVLRVFPQ